MIRTTTFRLLAAVAMVASAAIVGAPSAGANQPPPTLSGEYVFLSNPVGFEDGGGFTVSCDEAGTSTVDFDTAAPTLYPTAQFVPDAGYFDPEPNPFPRDVPYAGPVSLAVHAALGAHTLPPMGLDFSTGWYNEQQGTRGLAAAPVSS